jgi:hypothetical protein
MRPRRRRGTIVLEYRNVNVNVNVNMNMNVNRRTRCDLYIQYKDQDASQGLRQEVIKSISKSIESMTHWLLFFIFNKYTLLFLSHRSEQLCFNQSIVYNVQ